jgi:hypothetical protein
MSTNNLQRQVELTNAIFGLSPRYFVGVGEYGGSLGDTMAIARHGITYARLLSEHPGQQSSRE